jgi:hypothetical protein
MRSSACCLFAAAVLVGGCKGGGESSPLRVFRQEERVENPTPPPGFRWIEVPFSDDDAFDALLESYLVRNRPAIRITLDTTKPDWSGRLNTWLRAFCAGGKVRTRPGKGGAEQLLWLAAGARTPTEARQLLETVLDRIEHYATTAADWWSNEQKRKERIALIRPYTLDAVHDPQRDNKYTILLYNGHYE